jgi:hypothetical protein
MEPVRKTSRENSQPNTMTCSEKTKTAEHWNQDDRTDFHTLSHRFWFVDRSLLLRALLPKTIAPIIGDDESFGHNCF